MIDVLSGSVATLTFNLADTGLIPASVSYRVKNAEGISVMSLVDIAEFDPAVSELTITIPASINELSATEQFGARTVELLVIGDGSIASTVMLAQSYRLVNSNGTLVTPTNTFVTLVGAEVLASNLIQIPAWLNATEQEKTAALMDAHRRICALRFRGYYAVDVQRTIAFKAYDPEFRRSFSIADMSLSQYTSLDPSFRSALALAQVIQAADLMNSLNDQTLREAGVLRVKVGDSSRVYRDVPVNNRQVCVRARFALSRFLASSSLTLGRS